MDIKMTSGLCTRSNVSAASKPAEKEKRRNSESTAKLDTFERSASRRFGDTMISGSADRLQLDGPVPSSGSLEYFDPVEHDGIDWERLEKEFFGNRQVTIDNADALMGNVDHMVSMYVAVKSTLEQKFSDQEEVLAEKMERLNGLLDKAKEQITDSYGNTVGRFYERMGNPEASAFMKSSLSDAIDRRIAEMEEVADSMESFGNDASYTYRQVVMEVWAFNQREEGILSRSDSEHEGESYRLEDLEAAGMAAKAAAYMKFGGLFGMSDEELGISLASRYMKMACILEHSQAGDKMSGMILKSFGTFLNQHSGGGTADRVYNDTLARYHSTGDEKEAIAQSGRKYMGDGFFADFRNFGSDTAMSLSTRYNLDMDQFLQVLTQRGCSAALAFVSETGRQGFSAYI